MSGGSYNYLYVQEADELLAGGWDMELDRMADRLAALGYTDAAQETHDLIASLRQARARISSRKQRLWEIFQAVEWLDSADSGPEAVKEGVENWRTAP